MIILSLKVYGNKVVETLKHGAGERGLIAGRRGGPEAEVTGRTRLF